jgi:hypothetical protein
VLPNFTGAQAPDFTFYETIKKELDKNSVERSFQGITPVSPTDETATGDMSAAKAQSLKVASMFDGIISGHKQLFWLRTYNIAKNWTKPIDTEVEKLDDGSINLIPKYRTVTMQSELDGGQKVTKKIIFTTKTPKRPGGKATLEDSQDLHQQELDYAKESGGKEVRITTIHPELFAAMEQNWFYDCIPVPNDSDPMSYIMFAKQIQDATTFFGPDSMNVKKLKHRFANLTGNDFDTWFLNEQDLAQKQAQTAAANAGAGGGMGGGGQAYDGSGNPVGGAIGLNKSTPNKVGSGGLSPAAPAASARPMARMGNIVKR